MAAAPESAVAILSNRPGTAEKSFVAARGPLTPPYKNAHTKLTDDGVTVGVRHDHVSLTATVPAALSVSATPMHAVATLLVDQAVTIGISPPTAVLRSIRPTMEKAISRRLIWGIDSV